MNNDKKEKEYHFIIICQSPYTWIILWIVIITIIIIIAIIIICIRVNQ
jgi:hypothetical protein